MSRIFHSLQRAEQKRLAHDAGGAGADQPSATDGAQPSRAAQLTEYERLARNIVYLSSTSAFRTVMVASPAHGEGASTIVSRLALALAGLGHPRVLVVDANFRRPRLHEVFHVEETGGLAELIAGEVALDAVTRDIGTPNLRLVTAGRQLEGTAQLLAAPRLGEVLGELGRAHDITILDAPPVLPYADALALASLVDRVVLVTQAGHTGRGHLERATAELVRSGATILGVVLNRTSSHAPPWLDRRFSA